MPLQHLLIVCVLDSAVAVIRDQSADEMHLCYRAVVFFDMTADGAPLGRIEMTVSIAA